MTGSPMTRGALATLLAALIASCASIPLSTALRLSDFDRSTLAGLDARAIRVRVAVPEGVELDTESIELGVMLATPERRVREAFALTGLARTRGARSAGWFGRDQPVVQHELAFAPEAAGRFAGLQRRALAGWGGRYELDVNARLSGPPPEVRTLRLWIDIRLGHDSPWVVLFDGAEVPLGAGR